MLRNKRYLGAAMVAALLTACLTAGTASGTSPGPVAKEAPASESFRTSTPSDGSTRTVITLISGDRAHVDRRGKVVRVQPGRGREHIAMSVQQVGTDTYVVPSDALSLVGQGTLDRRLFNVTGLLRARYDDAHRGTVPLIVSYAGKGRPAAEAALSAADVSVRRSLPAVSGQALTAPKRGSAEVWEALTSAGRRGAEARTAAPGITRVWLDGRRTAALDRSAAQIGAPAAWKAGFDGAGVKVAVLDTGVDGTHPDLKGVEIAQRNFSGSKNTVDHVGHGTHVASTLAGSGAKSGRHRGVAPGAKILDAKVLDDEGSGEDSGIIAGMQWAADNGARIANLSLGGEDTAGHDPLEAAVDRISAESGILFVIAAGNEGPDASTVGSPGSASSALTVGAVDRKDRIADFSSTGPTADGSLKPDITAPGVGIVAAKAAKGTEGTPAAPGYVSMSGTSMATPHVAGAAAVLAQQHPDWTGQRIKQALTASARPGTGMSPLQQGTGRTDLTRAITQSVVTEQTSVNFGTQLWPHGDDKPVIRRITYRNDGTEPVTLTLSTETTGPGGKAAPAGFFAVGTDRVTVPAGGTAGVDLTADTRIGKQDGTFTGMLVARATEGGQSVRTAFGVRREAEAYDLTLKYTGTDGRPSQSGTLVLGHADVLLNAYDTEGDGIVRIRVPRGTYLLETPVQTRKGTRATPDVALMVQPKLSVTKATTVTFDARRAKPVDITVPQGARSVDTYLKYVLETDETVYGSVWQQSSFNGFRTGHVGSALPAEEFSSHIGGTWQKGSTTYNLLYDRTRSLHTGLAHKVARSELALVKNRIGVSAKKRTGAVSPVWETAAGVGHETVSRPFALPATANTYVNTRKGVTWGFSTGQYRPGSGDDGLEIIFNEPNLKTYQRGKTYAQTFNVGVFSPKIDRYNTARRMGNDLSFCIGEYADGAGHVGLSTVTKQQTRVTVDGKKLLGSDEGLCEDVFGLPSKSAAYRISTEATRPTKVAGVTTRLAAAWTFRSRKTPADDYTVLPLSSVRFAPKLDLYSRAPAGRKLTVPLTLQGPAAKNLGSLSVQVSYNGGKKWSKAPVLTRKGKRTLSLKHPAGATSVSLKAALTDKQGNTYKVTIVKAYLLK
ncbi:S8 family peptidase [Streptomyces cyaneofuscatus]